MAEKAEGHTSKPSAEHKEGLTAQECFEESARILRALEDPAHRAQQGYSGTGFADAWRRLGLAIKGVDVRGNAFGDDD